MTRQVLANSLTDAKRIDAGEAFAGLFKTGISAGREQKAPFCPDVLPGLVVAIEHNGIGLSFRQAGRVIYSTLSAGKAMQVARCIADRGIKVHLMPGTRPTPLTAPAGYERQHRPLFALVSPYDRGDAHA